MKAYKTGLEKIYDVLRAIEESRALNPWPHQARLHPSHPLLNDLTDMEIHSAIGCLHKRYNALSRIGTTPRELFLNRNRPKNVEEELTESFWLQIEKGFEEAKRSLCAEIEAERKMEGYDFSSPAALYKLDYSGRRVYINDQHIHSCQAGSNADRLLSFLICSPNITHSTQDLSRIVGGDVDYWAILRDIKITGELAKALFDISREGVLLYTPVDSKRITSLKLSETVLQKQLQDLSFKKNPDGVTRKKSINEKYR